MFSVTSFSNRTSTDLTSIRPHKLPILVTISTVVLAITLTLGLWPFHAPRNSVKWLEQANGLSFNRYGTVVSVASMPPNDGAESAARTIEVWLRGEPWQSGSFVSFYNREASVLVSMRESLTDFELIEYSPLSHQFRKRARLYASDVFHSRELRFISVTSGHRGVKVYVNGQLAAQARTFQVKRAAFNGRLIVGDAASHTDTWRGEIRGIAIYDVELPPKSIMKHYYTWKRHGTPTISAEDNISHLYLMNERTGTTIHDKVKPALDLVIPNHYSVLGKLALDPMWNEFELSRSFAASTLKNIVGFVPLGVSFYLFALICKWKRPALMVILAGFAVSLTIELLQIFLPTRESGTTDLVTNTLGAYFGILVCQLVGPASTKWLDQRISRITLSSDP